MKKIIVTSIVQLITLSLATAEVPVVWKIFFISPFSKIIQGSKDNIAIYRPISPLPLFSKILEKAVCHQIIKYLDNDNIINKITNDILKNMERGFATALMLTNLSKALDTVAHNKLLFKRSKYDVDNYSVFWFKSYLSYRVQHVKVDSTLSKESHLQCGFHRGYVLGPVLFTNYLNDLLLILAENTSPLPFPTNHRSYADDTQMYNAAPVNMILAAHKKIHDDIDILKEWFTKIKLKANPDKFKYMLIGTGAMLKRIPEELSKMEIYNNTLTRVKEAKILGNLIDQNLNWETHIRSFTNRCNGKLIQLTKIRKCMSQKTFRTIVKLSNTSTLDYCDIVDEKCQ